MNILHVVQLYYPVASGAGRYFAEVGERLAREDHHVTVLSTDAYDLEHFWAAGRRRVEVAGETRNGVEIVRLPVRRLPGSGAVPTGAKRCEVMGWGSLLGGGGTDRMRGIGERRRRASAAAPAA